MYPIRPLVSQEATQKFLETEFTSLHTKKEIYSYAARDSKAREYGFNDWIELTRVCKDCCVLLDKSTVVYSRELPVDLHRAWKLITDARELSTWMFETELDLKVGGRFSFPTWQGTITKLKTNQCIRFTADEGGYSEFEIEEMKPDQTVARITDHMPGHLKVPDHVLSEVGDFGTGQSGGLGTHWAGLLAGWHCGSDSLQAYASNRKSDSKYGALTRLYSELIAAYHNFDQTV